MFRDTVLIKEWICRDMEMGCYFVCVFDGSEVIELSLTTVQYPQTGTALSHTQVMTELTIFPLSF